MNIFMLRHCTTYDNEHGINGSQTDTPLSEAGVEESKKIAEELSHYKFDVIIVSPLQRTMQTIEPYLSLREDILLISDERTIERNLGGLTNTVSGDGKIEKHRKQQGADVISWTPPNGESILDVRRRAEDFLRWLCNEHADKNVLIVGHKNFLRNLELLILNRPAVDFYLDTPPRLHNGELRNYEYSCTKKI